MGRPKLCRNKSCRSDGEKRGIYALGLCEACWARDRRRKRHEASQEASVDVVEAQENLSELESYVRGRSAEFRRLEVQALRDLGMSKAAIIREFAARADLQIFIAGLQAPLKALERDILALEQADKGKGRALIEAEQVIRVVQRKLADPKTAASAHAHLAKLLAETENVRARLAGEVRIIAGVGLVPISRRRRFEEEAEDYEDEDDDGEDEEAFSGGNTRYEIPTVRAQGDVYGAPSRFG